MSTNETNRPSAVGTPRKNKAKLIAQRDFFLKETQCETIEGKSETVPDDTMSIRDIVERYTRGQRIPDNLMRKSQYDSGADFDSLDLEEVSRMDLADVHQIKEDNKNQILEKQTFFENAKKKQQEEERDRQRSSDDDQERPKKSRESKASDQREGGTTTSKKRANPEQKHQGDPDSDD